MKNIRYILEALALGIFLIISKILPVEWASNMGGWIGHTIGPRLAASRKARTNVELALPDLNSEEVDKIISGMWENLGRVMMEYPHLKKIARDRTEIIGGDILKQYLGKPVVLISAHLANWEVIPTSTYLQQQVKVSSVYRAPNNPIVDKLLNYSRSLGGRLGTIPKSKTGARNLVQELQNNHNVGILIDQKFNEGVPADFFGRPAMTSPVFVKLAQKFNCPLIPIYIERLPHTRFRVMFMEPLDIKEKTVDESIAMAHGILEDWIREKPQHWLWLHRRWDSGKLKEQEKEEEENYELT